MSAFAPERRKRLGRLERSALTGVLVREVVNYQFQRTYDAILAAPVDTEELVTAEALWIATRAGVYGCVPMLVAMVFGLDPSWGMLAVPLVAWIAGFGWACFGISVAGFSKSFENFKGPDLSGPYVVGPRTGRTGPDGPYDADEARKARTTRESNCVPAPRSSSARASWSPSACR